MQSASGVLERESRYEVPSYGDVSQYMNQQFTLSEDFSHGIPSSGDPFQGGGGFAESFILPQMSFILQMMETMMAKLPQVFAIFEAAGLQTPPESRSAYEKGIARFTELKGPCAGGDMQSCFQLTEVADIMMEMRPAMEKAIWESGKWEVGMQIGQLMSQGMGGMPIPPGMMR